MCVTDGNLVTNYQLDLTYEVTFVHLSLVCILSRSNVMTSRRTPLIVNFMLIILKKLQLSLTSLVSAYKLKRAEMLRVSKQNYLGWVVKVILFLNIESRYVINAIGQWIRGTIPFKS